MAQPWNMAQLRSRQPPRKYTPVGPVGEPVTVAGIALRKHKKHARSINTDRVCDCGYHVCSCEPGLDYAACERCLVRVAEGELTGNGLCLKCTSERVEWTVPTACGDLTIVADPRVPRGSAGYLIPRTLDSRMSEQLKPFDARSNEKPGSAYKFPLPRTLESRMSILEGLQELGMLEGEANRHAAVKLLLTGES